MLQSAPELAQNAARDVLAQQLQDQQKTIQETDGTEKSDELSRKVDKRAEQRRKRQEQRRRRRQAKAMQNDAGPATRPEHAAPDSQTDEVAGLIVDTSV